MVDLRLSTDNVLSIKVRLENPFLQAHPLEKEDEDRNKFVSQAYSA